MKNFFFQPLIILLVAFVGDTRNTFAIQTSKTEPEKIIFKLSSPTEPYGIGKSTRLIVDEGLVHPLEVHIWYPVSKDSHATCMSYDHDLLSQLKQDLWKQKIT